LLKAFAAAGCSISAQQIQIWSSIDPSRWLSELYRA
jgi:hypothetical protein